MSGLGVLADHHCSVYVLSSHHQTRKCILFASLLWHPFLPRSGLFLSPYLSWHAPNGSSSACLFWVVSHPSRTPPRKSLSQNHKNRFSPLLTTKPCPLILWPPDLTMLCIGWVQAGGAWALRVPSFHMCPKLACCPFVCCGLEARHPCFLTSYVGCSLFSRSIQELGFIWWWVLHFFGPLLGFLYFLQCRTVIPAVIT